jgi:hypothetical protein
MIDLSIAESCSDQPGHFCGWVRHLVLSAHFINGMSFRKGGRMKIHKKLAFATACMLGLLGNAAYADTACSFTISGVAIGPDGTVAATFANETSSHYWVLCSVTSTWSVSTAAGSTTNITSESCKALYSMLLTVRASNRSITLNWNSIADCSTGLPAGGVPNPYPYNSTL